MQTLTNQLTRHGRRWAVLTLIALTAVASFAANNAEIEQRLRNDVKYLASEDLQGRGVDTKGLELAAQYIAKQFEQAGLQPGGVNGSYFQPFDVISSRKLKPGSKVVFEGPNGQTIVLDNEKDFSVMGFSAAGKVTAPVVFVGYGATAPRIKYDDYQGVDVEGKVVVMIRRTPRWDDKKRPFDGDKKMEHATLNNKLANAELHKAAAMILVSDRSELKSGDKLISFRTLARGFTTGSIPAVHVKREAANRLLKAGLSKELSAIEETVDKKLESASSPLKGWRATIVANVEQQSKEVKNVVGYVPGSGPLAKEIVIIGAHHDHLGYGERGSRAKKKEDKNKIHFGADDNASGTAAVIELARRFGAMKERRGRTLVFMTFSAEEKGLLGSKYYCNKEPLFPLDRTVAMVNLDMVGRMQADKKSGKGKLIAQGVGTAKGFQELVEKFNEEYDFHLIRKKGGTGPSDHDSFYRKKIPVLFFWTGVHKDYHLPTDTWDKVNYTDLRRVTGLAEDVVKHLSTESERPQYVYVKSQSAGPIGNMPKMGIAPEYATEKKGLLIGGVSPGGPAHKAGMKAGDLIVEIAGNPVTNINTYMFIMRKQKKGKEIPVRILRGKKELTLKVAPQ